MQATYRESPARGDLATRVECVWYRIGQASEKVIVPDGCVDLIWLDGRELVVAGADQGPRAVTSMSGVTSFGIRLRPGAAGAMLGLPASEVVDRQVAADLLWTKSAPRLADKLSACGSGRQFALLQHFVAAIPGTVDGLVVQAARSMAVSADRIAVIADNLGVSERTLHRRTSAAVGYGPKMLARVMRLRRLQAIASEGAGGFAELAYGTGYASQAHMSDDVRVLTGMTPVRFLEYSRGTRP